MWGELRLKKLDYCHRPRRAQCCTEKPIMPIMLMSFSAHKFDTLANHNA